MRALSSVLILAPLVLSSCGGDDPTKPKPPAQGQIVFSSYGADSTNFTHLFIINADGTGLRQLTADSLNDRFPRWSPDGTKIAFTRSYGPNRDSVDVSVMGADGKNIVRLTVDAYLDEFPSWSPDGTQIAFQRTDLLVSDIWVVNADGTNPHMIMRADSANSARDITWTSQNTLLGADTYGIDLQLAPTSTRLTRILDLFPINSAQPRLSPSSDVIAFAWEGPNANEGPYVYTVKVDGSGMKQISNLRDRTPVWSPDGSRIAFQRDSRIWIMASSGANPVQLTTRTTPGADNPGDWK